MRTPFKMKETPHPINRMMQRGNALNIFALEQKLYMRTPWEYV